MSLDRARPGTGPVLKAGNLIEITSVAFFDVEHG
jgi:hypothetical protein